MARYVRENTFAFGRLQLFSAYILHSFLRRLGFGVAHVCSLETSVSFPWSMALGVYRLMRENDGVMSVFAEDLPSVES